MEDRLGFGIPELDKALGGGIPKGNVVLISGGPGTGKSTFCLRYLLEGARKGHRGVYISTEQTPEELRRQASRYGWEFPAFEEKGLIRFVFVNILKEATFMDEVRGALKAASPDRVVIDSLTAFSGYAAMNEFARQTALKQQVGMRVVDLSRLLPRRVSETSMTRQMLASLISEVKGFKATTLLTSELPEKSGYLSSDGISEFLSDGVVLLHHLGVGLTQFRSLNIRKMRYTGHSSEYFAYEFGDDGIVFVENAV
jgi:KaiC/GvpD/RAD55 family RecA-like ATPase